MKKTNTIEKLNAEKANSIRITTEVINSMKVIDLRKLAPKLGVKNAKQYKGAELKEMLIKAATEKIEAEYTTKIAEASKATKKSSKQDKRYKATKVAADDVDALVEQIINASPAEVEQMDLWQVNRKVLIEAMKRLHCKMWYRTYDKPTMISKINAAMVAA